MLCLVFKVKSACYIHINLVLCKTGARRVSTCAGCRQVSSYLFRSDLEEQTKTKNPPAEAAAAPLLCGRLSSHTDRFTLRCVCPLKKQKIKNSWCFFKPPQTATSCKFTPPSQLGPPQSYTMRKSDLKSCSSQEIQHKIFVASALFPARWLKSKVLFPE